VARAVLILTLMAALAACAAQPPVRHGAPALVDSATMMLGQPYRYGGFAPGGFDCSGLVYYAARRAGLEVPRTAAAQLASGTAVARAAVRAGDLVFMHLSHKELHVGIAVGGERFIHAPSSGGRVRIDSLSAPPYDRGFFSARRIAPDAD